MPRPILNNDQHSIRQSEDAPLSEMSSTPSPHMSTAPRTATGSLSGFGLGRHQYLALQLAHRKLEKDQRVHGALLDSF